MSHPPLLQRARFARHLIVTLAIAPLLFATTAQWPNWRGPTLNGSVAAGQPPARWDATHIAWRTPLPGKGCSTPIVWGDRIYVTAPIDGKDGLVAFALDGKRLWQTALGSHEQAGRHRNGSGSNPSPVTDGRSIFVSYKSGQLAAVGLDGQVRWQTNLVERFGPVKLFWDFGSSPVLAGKNVVVARLHGGESWLAAFDQATGELRWKTDRTYSTPTELDNGYTTPLVIRHEGREALLTWGAEHVTAHDAVDGRLLWSCGDFNPKRTAFWPAVAMPVVIGDIAAICFGRADKGAPQFHGVKLGGSGDVTKTHRTWSRDDVGAFVPTPAEYQGQLYVLSDRGQIDCVEPATGKSRWTATLPRASSNYYASPLIVGGVLYAAREDGVVFVAKVAGGFELLAENKLPDRVIASLVPVGDRLIIRGEKELFCIAPPAAGSRSDE
ncbi:MAG: PQQ-binding-like beta-propeller repeat protein [Verrucomicrobia bacterium]|nr:PQQ-binding-like beta-propeller repeat protein [Verrucomicrobiota bacterium]